MKINDVKELSAQLLKIATMMDTPATSLAVSEEVKAYQAGLDGQALSSVDYLRRLMLAACDLMGMPDGAETEIEV